MKTIYLSGPIHGCTDGEAIDWRNLVKTVWDGYVLDPMRHAFRGVEHEYVQEIVELDKTDIDKCDIVLVNYYKPSVGTSMEILYAWERGKHVVIVTNKSREDMSPWLIYHAHHIVNSFSRAVHLIKEMS
jgi:nucleoside 2-deoxyribosyltransferase